ncbi:hypothetical protein COT78_00550 [Candidatus Berkelbacteria bacterium CG10_big_fil_rev_8_21_14_0_10_43_13]|uniref:Uncharacterized protein n=1 Tax=Candidatus Berkelbacteria bacterium CG10_big_fil_rev_8_21_14_0_10_43_13 TaxID=1974514 RepID=A0A2H0W7A4_9BACT|nr:MAG: hypothetical protein COT78_00550 [Candidatus Berkelbacteria bacterium CG10_big_fil_rev_8_21_14_0_10_43_13]
MNFYFIITTVAQFVLKCHSEVTKNPFDFAPAFVKVFNYTQTMRASRMATAGRQDRSIRSFTFRTTSVQDDNYATLVIILKLYMHLTSLLQKK